MQGALHMPCLSGAVPQAVGREFHCTSMIVDSDMHLVIKEKACMNMVVKERACTYRAAESGAVCRGPPQRPGSSGVAPRGSSAYPAPLGGLPPRQSVPAQNGLHPQLVCLTCALVFSHAACNSLPGPT